MKQNYIEDNVLILSKQTIDSMLSQSNPSLLISLYCFYYYTAKWQKTNILKCTTGYVSNGLKISREAVIEGKKSLKILGLISDEQTHNKKGQITGWYIKLNYIWKRSKIQKVALPEAGLPHPVAKAGTNALSVDTLNALNVNREEGNKGNTPSLQTSSSLKTKETPLQRVVNHFFKVKGYEDKKWINENFARHVKPAKLLLKLGEPDKVISIIDRAPAYFKKEKLPSWTLETVNKRWNELNGKKKVVRYE